MCTTATSTFLNFDSPPTIKLCGEVYCSQDLEQYFLNCKACSQEFNLLSCSLFIKHIRECFSVEAASSLEINTTNRETEINAVNISLNNASDDHTTQTNEDPLSYMKVEISRDEANNDSERDSGGVNILSDCHDEDDLAVDNLERRKFVEVVIDEYKKRPVLWQTRDNKAGKRIQFQQMRNSVNAKLKKNYNCLELRNQISNLRTSYKRALKKKDEVGSAPTLWYFDKLSFLDQSSHNLNVEKVENELFQDFLENSNQSGANVEDSNYADNLTLSETLPDGKCTETADNDEKFDISNDECQEDASNEDDLTIKCLMRRELISKIIEEYKKRPILWQDGHNREARKTQFAEMRTAINKNLKQKLTVLELRDKIARIRDYYKRVLKRKELYQRLYPEREDFVPRLWYFDKLGFLQKTFDDNKIDLERRKCVSEETMDCTAKSNMNQEDISFNEQKSTTTEATTREDPLELKKPLEEMQPDIEKESLFPQNISMLENKEMRNDTDENSLIEELIPTKLKFKEISNNPSSSLKVEKYQAEDEEEDMGQLSDYQDEDFLTIDNLMRRKLVEGIIDEYRKRPAIWQNRANQATRNHHFKQMRKAINAKFKKNYTDLELHVQIRSLRSSYRRALQQKQRFEAKNPNKGRFVPQLWYFNKFSFLEQAKYGHKGKPPDQSELNLSEVPKEDSSDDEQVPNSDEDYSAPGSRTERRVRPDEKVLSEPKIILEIIKQYKSYAFLWDQTAKLYGDKYARKDAYHQMTKSINATFCKKVTERELRQQIINLRSVYRRAQRKQHSANYHISLWYYKNLSFIDNKSDQPEDASQSKPVDSAAENSTVSTENLKIESLDESQECEMFDSQNYFDEEMQLDEANSSTLGKNVNSITLSIIEEYKRHPCLWDSYTYKTASRQARIDANKAIAMAINSKFNTSFTNEQIRNKIVQLRSSYRRVLRCKEAFEKKHANAKRKFHPQLWYFDKMAFIGAKESDFWVSRRKKQKTKSGDIEKDREKDMDVDVDEEEEEECAVEENNETLTEYELASNGDLDSAMLPEVDELRNCGKDVKRNPIWNVPLIKKKNILTAIIEEYKKKTCLWAVKHYTNDNHYRRKAFEQIANAINDRFDTTFTYRDISSQILKLCLTYRRMLRRKQSHKDGEFKTKMWYADLLSFIETKPEDLRKLAEDEIESDADANNLTDKEDQPQETTCVTCDENLPQRKNKFPKKGQVFKIIELYKAAPVLWDKNHPRNRQVVQRKKAMDQIIATLSQEHDCCLTTEEFRYQIRFLKESYFRTVRQEAALKRGDFNCKYISRPFFYNQMSFLEPFANKEPIKVPKLQIFTQIQPSEDFSFLTENRSLMMAFIEMYKANNCLWDQNNKDHDNDAAHSEAYDKLIDMFLQHDVSFTREQVLAAISFLHATVVNTQKSVSSEDKCEETAWFYEHLKFLGRIPRFYDKFCDHCGQHFRSSKEYEQHKIEIAGDYPYKCFICNAGFVSRSKYAYHQITHKEPHKCDICDFQAYDRHNFNVHMRRHKGIHSYKCEHCDKGFVTSTELTRHLRKHTGEKAFICDICGKALASNSEFYQHLKRHRNQRDHKCDVCGSAFFTLKILRDHMASHSAERTHICEVCGAAFKRKKTLNQHKALHLEEKKHECKICGKQFAQKAGVYSHMKSHGLMLGNTN